MSVAHRCIGALAFTLCVATGVSPRATTPAFKSTGSMHVARAGHQATLLRDGRVIVTGGYDRSGNAVAASEIFDPPTAAWALAGANIIARLDHTATRLSDGRVLVAGGLPSLSSCEPTPIGEVYDATTQQWSPTRNLPVSPGAGATAVALASGRLLLTGGTICGRSSNAAMLYDPSGNTWSATAPMRASRAFHSALLLADGRALVVGGGANESVNAEIYDPAQATWTTVDNGAAPRAASCGGYVQTFLTVLTNALVLAAGGITGDCATGAAPVSNAEVFDLATARWSSAGHVEFRRALTSPTLLPDGRVLLAGGYTDRGVVAASELFDPATGAWEVNGRLQTARAGHTATRLTNGTVLIAGGSNSDGRTATAEIYLPEISYAASAMAWPRGFSGPSGTSFFGQPWGIATNAAGHTFLSYLPGGDRNILEWARPLRPAPGGYLSELGGGQERVHSIRIDNDDNIWAIGGTTNTITQFDAAGRVLLRFGAAPPDAAERGQPADEATPYLQDPTDLARDSRGNIFVTDTGHSRVAKYDRRGRFVGATGRRGSAPGQMHAPHSIVTDARERIYVADGGNARIQVFDSALHLLAVYDAVGSPWSLCITAGPHQYLYSSSNPDRTDDTKGQTSGDVYKLELDGTIVGRFGRIDNELGNFRTLHAMECRQDNEILATAIVDGVQTITLRP